MESDSDDREPFVLADGKSASRNAEMIENLEKRLRDLGCDALEIEDAAQRANDRNDAVVMRRLQAWESWARRRGTGKVRVHVTQLCGGRVEAVGSSGCWRCRLCLRVVPTGETGHRPL